MNINKNGFTLIEILAVIIILGVIMTIAVPNVLSMLDRNKKDTFIENAKLMANQAEYTIRKDTEIEYPSEGNAIILTLEYLNTNDISESPYGTSYSPTKSFVAIVNNTTGGITEYKYYVHLVACTDNGCANTDENSVNKNRGINLINIENLAGSNRFSHVKQDIDVDVTLGIITAEGSMLYEDSILLKLGIKDTLGKIEKIYDKLS